MYLQWGTGEPIVEYDYVRLLKMMVILWGNDLSINELIDSTFPNMEDDSNYIVTRAIITPKNVDVDRLKSRLLKDFQDRNGNAIHWITSRTMFTIFCQIEFLNFFMSE